MTPVREFTYEPSVRTAYCCAQKLMGTRLEIILTDIEKRAAELLCEQILGEVIAADSLLNRFDPSSELSRLNSALKSSDLAPISPELARWIKLAEGYKRKTGGLFDVKYSGEYDFGGMAKGAMLKSISELLRGRGVNDALINFGGSSIYGLGHHPFGDSWSIDVPDPFGTGNLCTVNLRDSGLSVSGNTPGYSAHIVNPSNGERISSRRIVVVQSPDPLDAEVLSTTLMVAHATTAFPDSEIKVYE